MAGPGQGEVWLYKDGKYVGTTWKYDESKPNFEDLGCDEKVSSLRVGPGVTVILFDKKNYGGSSIEYNADAPTLGRFNDKSRSMKLLKEAPQPLTPGPGEVFVYRDSNFGGYVWRLRDAVPDFAKIGAGKTVSSIRVGPSTEAVMYADANFSGKVITITSDMASLGDWNDKGVSLKIFKSA